MDLRKELVVLETDRYRASGTMTLAATGHRSRLSDHVNRRDVRFFTLQEVTVTPLDGGEEWNAPVLMVAADHIRVILPAPEG